VERAVLRLWISGERSTSAFARETGMDELPRRQQCAEVKRLKDRVLRRFRRHLVASGRRIIE
jgi:hypothetical protein